MTVDFGVRRLGHANVSVRDLDRSVAFFEKVCGFERSASRSAPALASSPTATAITTSAWWRSAAPSTAATAR